MFRNPLRRSDTYLRKKSDLLRDVITGFLIFSSLGLFVQYQYNKFNPPDPVDEPQYSQDYNLIDFIQDKLRKQVQVKQQAQSDNQ